MSYKKKNVKRLIAAASHFAQPRHQSLVGPVAPRIELAEALAVCIKDRKEKKKKRKEAEPDMYFARTSREDMHRRAQAAEGKLAKTLWWVERLLALHEARGEYAHGVFLVHALQSRGRDIEAATKLARKVEQMTEPTQDKQQETENAFGVSKADGGSCCIENRPAPTSGNIRCSAARIVNGVNVGPCTNKATTVMKKDGSPAIYRCDEHADATVKRWPSLWRRPLI